MTSAIFCVPGKLETATGGYRYARNVLRKLTPARTAFSLVHWPLPELGLTPCRSDIEETAHRLGAAPSGWPVLIDGLALGALPVEILREAQGPLAALIHHPLALEHGLDADQAGALAVQERAALAECGAVITTSSHTAETLIAEFGVSREAITVARPGIPRPEPFVGRVEVSDNVKILSVGTLTSRKGHDILIEALAQHRHLPWQLTILGDDTREPDYTADLHRRVDRHGLNERISFRGVVESYSLARSFATADLFVLASRYEGYGMAFAEAMAAGLPVLGTDAGAVSEATAGGAMLVPPDDVAALSEALGPLLADAGARAALAARGRSAARTLATWDDTAAAVTQALMPLTAAQAAVGAPPPPADTALETGR